MSFKTMACNDRPTVSLLVPGAGSTQSSPDCVHRTDLSGDGADICSPLTDGVKEKSLTDVTCLTSETKDTELISPLFRKTPGHIIESLLFPSLFVSSPDFFFRFYFFAFSCILQSTNKTIELRACRTGVRSSMTRLRTAPYACTHRNNYCT